MITEDQLEQLAIQWFQDTGWSYVNGKVISPEGEAAEREDFRAVVLKGRLAEAVGRLNPKLPAFGAEESGGGAGRAIAQRQDPLAEAEQGGAAFCCPIGIWK